MRTIGESFIDVDFSQHPKHGQQVCGDVFRSRKLKNEGRIVSVLSDGLGSGVKASVLANLTATMALRYTSAFVDVRKSAGTRVSLGRLLLEALDRDGLQVPRDSGLQQARGDRIGRRARSAPHGRANGRPLGGVDHAVGARLRTLVRGGRVARARRL